MDWQSVFDEAYPLRGATEADIARFIAEIGQPLSPAEITEVNESQSNPFPKDDPMHAAWRPFDAAKWLIPIYAPPAAYLSLLRWSNGGEFRKGGRCFQFFPTIDPQHGVRSMMVAYHVPQYMPGALPVAFNGAGTFYLLDMRRPPVADEYPIVCAEAGNLGWEADQCIRVADSFEAACRGTVDVDDLRWSDGEWETASEGGDM